MNGIMANSVEPAKTTPLGQSGQGLPCLPNDACPNAYSCMEASFRINRFFSLLLPLT